MLYLKAPDPERYLPWKIGERPSSSGEGIAITSGNIEGIIWHFVDLSRAEHLITPPQPPMSRKFDRARQAHAAALEVLKGSVRRKPRWIPRLLWNPIYWLAWNVIFK